MKAKWTYSASYSKTSEAHFHMHFVSLVGIAGWMRQWTGEFITGLSFLIIGADWPHCPVFGLIDPHGYLKTEQRINQLAQPMSFKKANLLD